LNDPYLISSANFIACHNPSFLEKYDLLSSAEEGAVFLLTTRTPKRPSGTPCLQRYKSNSSPGR
jgi:Pyruvate/2-oxoacid:ferredoxin oxidoreductase gamma subunit